MSFPIGGAAILLHIPVAKRNKQTNNENLVTDALSSLAREKTPQTFIVRQRSCQAKAAPVVLQNTNTSSPYVRKNARRNYRRYMTVRCIRPYIAQMLPRSDRTPGAICAFNLRFAFGERSR
jgi:hypothetical protein